ncbi:aminotransferase class I/II-fold pyridoxal phosphate-dependent enzyme [Parvibaculum sp.]|uniref:pyridoxal phosphate-dependent aminotransferase n=1 Tax=Parvibaculum sp. TaxID=2024848 RepID=UPI00321069E2
MADAPEVSRRSGVAPFIAMDVMRDATALEGAGGQRIMHLEVGQPSTQAPQAVRDAAARALEVDRLGYTDALGLLSLRQRIARHYGERHGLDIAPERVVVTAGSSGGFILALLACFDAGARVAISEPGYPAYRNILLALGLTPVGIPVGPETRWSLTPELIDEAERRHGRIDGVLVASPANPTGTMMTPAALAELSSACAAQRRWFISDEIYHGIVFGAETATALSSSADAIVVNSFSKYYCMTGWRLGWLVVPERLMRPLERLAQNLFIAPSSVAQAAGAAAFDATQELDANVARYAANRELLLTELPKAGFDSFAPADGAFYLYADVRKLTNDSAEFCHRMLHEVGVAATPGLDFDPERGRQSIRMSFAGSTADMQEAVERLKRWLA